MGYATKAVDERAKMAKERGYCPICLYPGHQAEVCKSAKNPRSICGFEGCQKHHHSSPHGAEDRYITEVNMLEIKSVCRGDIRDTLLEREWMRADREVRQ